MIDENDVTKIYSLLQRYEFAKGREGFNYWDFIVDYLYEGEQ